MLCLMDDILIFGKDEAEHNQRLTKALQRIHSAEVTLNPNKCEFKRKQLKFLGHLIAQDGIRADPDKVSAIMEMKPPTNISELGKLSQNLAELTHPLRQLLTKKSTWLWGPEQDQVFSNVKAGLMKPQVLTLYSPEAPIKVSADASSYGLGAVLLQQEGSEWKPIAFASRSMTDTETQYAQIEKEALATTWACEKFATYILGRKFQIETDHKPLVPLDSLPPRILRFRLPLARFDYKISHVPGKLMYMYTANTLSRAPLADKANDNELEQDTEKFIEVGVVTLPVSEGRLDQYRKAQDKDSLCSKVKTQCKEGWLEKREIDHRVLPFWKARGNLSLDPSGLLLYRSRIAVTNLSDKKPWRRSITDTRASKDAIWEPKYQCGGLGSQRRLKR